MKRRTPARIELAAQVADLDVNDIGLRHEFEIPHILEQHCPRHDLAGAAHEIFQQGEFPRQEIDQFAVAARGPLDEVHFQRADLQSRLPRVAAPPQERFDARRQFADVERLDQVVVAARLQPIDSLVDRRERADHQGRRGVAFAAQRFDDRKPILAVQHAIDDQNRGARARRSATRRRRSPKAVLDGRSPAARGESPRQGRAHLPRPGSEILRGRPSIDRPASARLQTTTCSSLHSWTPCPAAVRFAPKHWRQDGRFAGVSPIPRRLAKQNPVASGAISGS